MGHSAASVVALPALLSLLEQAKGLTSTCAFHGHDSRCPSKAPARHPQDKPVQHTGMPKQGHKAGHLLSVSVLAGGTMAAPDLAMALWARVLDLKSRKLHTALTPAKLREGQLNTRCHHLPPALPAAAAAAPASLAACAR